MEQLISPEALKRLLLFAPPFIISLSFHEWAHAWSANKLGDSTARYMGRMTLDPMAHISWFGTVIFPAAAILMGAPFLFGWANPVPVDTRNFKKPLRDMALVAAAGPASNIVLAILLCIPMSYIHSDPSILEGGMAQSGAQMLRMAISLNLFLAFFNMIPLPPLDGSRILQAMVGPRWAMKIDQMAGQAQLILILLLFTGALRMLAYPVIIVNVLLFRLFDIPL